MYFIQRHPFFYIITTWFTFWHFGVLAYVSSNQSEQEALVQGNKNFAFDLYGQLRDLRSNLFFSPLSISAALTMTYAGARGDTESQMAEVLHLNLSQDQVHPAFEGLLKSIVPASRQEGLQLTICNSIWTQKGYNIENQFLKLLDSHYGTSLKKVDFSGAFEVARHQINNWVKEQTQSKIQEFIKPGVLNPLTRLVLTNAIYFKADWARQFDKKKTQTVEFYGDIGQQVECLMMTQTAMFNYWENDSFQILELPYKDRELSMVILLPVKITGLKEVEVALAGGTRDYWLSKLRPRMVSVFVPKFKLSYQIRLTEVLKLMGMPYAFSNLADFSGITTKKNLYISEVLHQAIIEVNEEGTEASAATGVVMSSRSASDTKIFRADHPFLFIIKDNQTGNIIFLGRITNPRT